MKEHSSTRRNIIKASFALPFLSQGIVQQAIASTYILGDSFVVHGKIHQLLVDIYGQQANHVTRTDKLQIETPQIAENRAVVPVAILGEKNLVKSVVMLVPGNAEPLVEAVTLSPYVDLPLRCRIRMERSGDIIVVAETRDGLLGIKQHVKIFVGRSNCT